MVVKGAKYNEYIIFIALCYSDSLVDIDFIFLRSVTLSMSSEQYKSLSSSRRYFFLGPETEFPGFLHSLQEKINKSS